MGGSSWSHQTYESHRSSRNTSAPRREQVFTQRNLDPEMDPKKVKNGVRESRDSDAHPDSNAIIVGLDETGSMGHIPERIARGALGKLMNILLDRGVIPHPQILFSGIGDGQLNGREDASLQVGQFESGLEMDHWLTKIYLEGLGGGNSGESYLLLPFWAARHTSIDCYEKRGRKGYLFTVGDEPHLNRVTTREVKDYLGDTIQSDIDAQTVVAEASETYHVFHVIIEEGSCGRSAATHQSWDSLLGARSLKLDNADYISEVIAAAIAVQEGVARPDHLRDDLLKLDFEQESLKSVLRAVEPFAESLKTEPEVSPEKAAASATARL